MIILLAASSIYMSALQAGITGPTDVFRKCLREAASKAQTEKVAADAIESYLKGACTAPMGNLREALISFRMKNGMSRSAAASDAAMTVNDYVATPADHYKFMASQDTKQAVAATVAKAPPAPAAKAVITPASVPVTPVTQPPKP